MQRIDAQERSEVFVHAWTGNAVKGIRFAELRYPGAQISALSHRELRESGWKGQISAFARLRGRAIVFYFKSLADVREPELLIWIHLLHRCRETVLADEAGNVTVITLRDCARHLPKLIVAITADLAVFSTTWFRFKMLRKAVTSTLSPSTAQGSPDIAYIYPYPLNREFSGGATTHFRGFLDGVAENGGTCRILSGCELPFALPFPVVQIPPPKKLFVFSESFTLSYNWHFASYAAKLLSGTKPKVIYQRHGRFVVAGVLLARALGVPFVLEYNGSEVWIANHWDPVRFAPWLRMAEEIALWGASSIVVVSEVLKTELIARGLPAERILVNPNGVDPSKFRPHCGDRDKLRRDFGFEPSHVVVAFVGTFSYWHGIPVLQGAIEKLLGESASRRHSEAAADNLRFLLIGAGPLQAEFRSALLEYEKQRRAVFAGTVAHDEVPAYLDAADILVSPHVPMPDGKPFIGSPTKLFEYMAMGKAIVASRLDQLEMVLTHNETALLVQPGNVKELADAIVAAAANCELRDRLGSNARAAAMANHTWKRNAANTLIAAGLRLSQADTPVVNGCQEESCA
ncbi:MAG TPA: glycosyltransferase family 4 protein [Terracidiphilus sp.]|nr:glycosyltransferase family 4 protein [Terracidiphilus sp.]